MSHPDLVSFLLRPESYPHHPEAVTLKETHISWVFLAGDRVYKVRKPVTFDFLDYGTLARRLELGRREIALNRRLAPDLYRGIVAITEEGGRLRLGGDGEVVAHAVEMNRLEDAYFLHNRLEGGEVSEAMIREVARALVDFHGRCETGEGVDGYGAPARVSELILQTFEGSQSRALGILSPALEAHLKGWVAERLDALAPLMAQRVKQGRIRGGHGDLRAEHLHVDPAGVVRAFDALEFSDALRCCDVAAELAFLCLELREAGEPRLARVLAQAYAEGAGDDTFGEVLPLYMVYRALVRGKVSGLRAAQMDPGSEREALLDAGATAYHTAYGISRDRPLLLLTYGMAGSGKSTLARALALALELKTLRSDVVHKQLQGVDPGERLETGFLSGAYTQEAKARTYQTLLEMATGEMASGPGVIVDASMGYPYMRDPFFERIKARGWDHALVEVSIGDEESRRRLDKRAAEGEDASDATYAIYLKQKTAFVPPEEVERRAPIDGTWPLRRQVRETLDALLAFEG